MGGKFVPVKPMAANSPTSRAGSQFRKPIASLALMAGAARRWTQNVFLREKIAEHLQPSTPRRFVLRFRPTARQSCAKATAPAKAAETLRVKFTISRSKPLKPTAQKEHSRLSEKHSD